MVIDNTNHPFRWVVPTSKVDLGQAGNESNQPSVNVKSHSSDQTPDKSKNDIRRKPRVDSQQNLYSGDDGNDDDPFGING